jgi:hypothetical protein
MPAIVQGQTFHTLAAFKEALRDWAIERNWTPHILDSDSHRVRAGCRSSPACPFRIRCNYGAKKGVAKVTTCDDNHTCEPFRASAEVRAHQDIKRAETGKLKFLLEAVPKLITVTLDTNVLEIIDAVERTYGQKIPTRQAQKVKASLTDRIKGPCRHCHQLGHTRRQCPQLRASASGSLDFSNLQHDITQFANGDGEDETYADGGLEVGGNHRAIEDQMDFVGIRQPDGRDQNFNSARSQPMPDSIHPQHAIVPNGFVNLQPTSSGIRADPIPAQGLQGRIAPVPERSATAQNPQAISQPGTAQTSQSIIQLDGPRNQGTPTDTRLEAAKLMQQAARLMHEAARLNAEAARLTASVANQ